MQALEAGVPYVAVGSLCTALGAVWRRRWIPATVAGLGVIAMAGPLIARARPNEQPAVPNAVSVTVMSLSLRHGQALPAEVVGLIRSHSVDVAVLGELTPAALEALDGAGLAEELGHRQAVAAPGSAGLGTFSRQQSRWDPEITYRPWLPSQVSTGMNRWLRVEALHGPAPRPRTTRFLRTREIVQRLPGPWFGGKPAIVVGDFNATLDNHVLRTLLGRGYRDAADETGAGLKATWTGLGGIARLQLDHVFVAPGVAVKSVDVVRVSGTDHRALLARLLVPTSLARTSANGRNQSPGLSPERP